MRWSTILWAVALVACTGNPSLPTPTRTATPSPTATSTQTPAPSTSPTPRPIPIASRTSTPAPPAVITPENAADLSAFKTIQFNSWEMVLALAWAPDGGTLAISAGERIHLYQTGIFREQMALDAGVWSPGLAFSPDAQWIASGGRDGNLRVWDADSGELRLNFPAHKKGINATAFLPSGEWLASAGNDGMVRLWEVGSGSAVGEMIGGSFGIPAIAFTPDGAGLAIANADVVRIRRVQDGTFMQTLRGEHSFYSLDLTRDGRRLATGGSDNSLLLWDMETGEILHTLEGHQGQSSRPSSLVWHVAFSPDGRLLASAGGDGSVRLWDVTSGKLLVTPIDHEAAVTSLAFSPDGRWLASGGLDGIVILWGAGHPGTNP